MKQVTLSDFVGDRVREAQRERAERYEFDRRAYELGAPKRRVRFIAPFGVCVLIAIALILWGNSLIEREGVGAAIGAYSYLIFPIIAMVVIAIRYLKQRPKMSEATEQENILISGEAGEIRTADAFRRVLNNNWVLHKGYKNSKGEIDQILVGPNGVTAIEIKNYNGVININGDSWTRHRHNAASGAEPAVEPVQDAGGRAPSRQLNEPASQLQEFLSERSDVKRINRAVVLTHDRSVIGSVYNLTVDHVVTLNDILRRDHHVFVFGDGRVRHDREAVYHISNLIKQDHNFHNKANDK